MILGIVLILIAVVAFYLIYRTDYEDVVVESEDVFEERKNRIYLYLGISIIFIIGVVSIVNDIVE